ncbi:cytidine deaminase [Ensifer sp. ENS06]|uniref:cytidine deaminase n=1 Tax=Ensifer sp. ENS06 TaxID=2769276 RepID=UPI00177F66E9|nr:cytidine deaminase [Ensifer sp. ENS06]MBD9627088.1 cytidine deaminase [Ensifer sp. ENS06]
MIETQLFGAAKSARSNAYVPYSNFPVACAIQSESGKIYVGVNVDNASFPETACAEANAIGALVAAGERRIKAVLVLGGHPGSGVLCTPCGGCRQRLGEFSQSDTMVYVCSDEGVQEVIAFGELLPRAFGPNNLKQE